MEVLPVQQKQKKGSRWVVHMDHSDRTEDEEQMKEQVKNQEKEEGKQGRILLVIVDEEAFPDSIPTDQIQDTLEMDQDTQCSLDDLP